MANENGNGDNLDISGEMERQFPAALNQATKATTSSVRSVATVTEQIKTLASTMVEMRREMDELEKMVGERLQKLRDRLGRL